MMLAEQGKIDLNAPLTRYYPEFQGTALGNNGATVTDLIHHTAGLPRELNPYPRDLQSVIDGVKDLPSVDPVGTHSYSNISYILLQQLIERATGESYSTLLETYLDPATGVTPLSRADTINSTVPAGHAPFFTGNLAVWEPIQDYEIGGRQPRRDRKATRRLRGVATSPTPSRSATQHLAQGLHH